MNFRFLGAILFLVLVACKRDSDLDSNQYVWEMNEFQNGGGVVRAALYECPNRTWHSEEFMTKRKYPSHRFSGKNAADFWNEVIQKVNTEYNKIGSSSRPFPVKYVAVFENRESKIYMVKLVLILHENGRTYVTADSKDQNWWFETTNSIFTNR